MDKLDEERDLMRPGKGTTGFESYELGGRDEIVACFAQELKDEK